MDVYVDCAGEDLDVRVRKVATMAAFRRCGLARRLMVLAENHAVEMGGESLTLEVGSSNGAAITMYETLEYDHVGIHARYYQDGENAVVMRKRMGN